MSIPDSPGPVSGSAAGHDAALVERIARAMDDANRKFDGDLPLDDAAWARLWCEPWGELKVDPIAALSALQPGDRVGPGGRLVVVEAKDAEFGGQALRGFQYQFRDWLTPQARKSIRKTADALDPPPARSDAEAPPAAEGQAAGIPPRPET